LSTSPPGYWIARSSVLDEQMSSANFRHDDDVSIVIFYVKMESNVLMATTMIDHRGDGPSSMYKNKERLSNGHPDLLKRDSIIFIHNLAHVLHLARQAREGKLQDRKSELQITTKSNREDETGWSAMFQQVLGTGCAADCRRSSISEHTLNH
jgi:hypothetical protein